MVIDADGRIAQWSPAAEGLTGYSSGDIVGRDVTVLAGGVPWRAVTGEEILEDVAGDMRAGVTALRRKDGTDRVVEWRAHPVTLSDGRSAVLGVAVDAGDIHATELDLALMDAFFVQSPFGFVVLDTDLRYVSLNPELANIDHRSIADHLGRYVHEVIESLDLEPYMEALTRVLQTGEPVLDLRFSGRATSAPVKGRVWSVSWYRINDESGSPLGICGIVFDVTDRERGMLDASRDRDRLMLLSRASARLGSSLDLYRTARDLTDLVVPGFCEISTVDVLDEVVSGGRLPTTRSADPMVRRLAASYHLDNARDPAMRQALDANDRRAATTSGFSKAMTSEEPQLFTDLRAEDFPNFVQDEDRLAAGVQLGVNSLIVAPLRARNVTLGAATFLRAGDREPFTPDDLGLVRELASRAALCIDNARLYRHEREAALALQRSLLPHRLPSLVEIDFAHRYRPSSDTAEAGGDWFDVIALPGRRVGLVIGDVTGHGIAAAATMGRYRTAVQSLASIGLDPGLLLTRINDLAAGFGDETLATCLYAIYDPPRHQCAFASAGHLPPILMQADGVSQVLATANDPVLAAVPGTIYHTSSVRVRPGSGLLLYTDGVVESRSMSIERGLDKLRRLLRGPTGDPGEVCDRILGALPTDGGDDVTLLLTRFLGPRGVIDSAD